MKAEDVKAGMTVRHRRNGGEAMEVLTNVFRRGDGEEFVVVSWRDAGFTWFALDELEPAPPPEYCAIYQNDTMLWASGWHLRPDSDTATRDRLIGHFVRDHRDATPRFEPLEDRT